MSNIKIYMKCGEIKEFPETSRAGGSYHTHIKYEGVFAIITEAYDKQTAIPSADIKEIIVEERNRW